MKTTAPPDPNTKKPKFRPPPLACDAHCHIFGPAAKFPYAPDAAYHPPDSPFEALQKLHSILGIERAVIVHASCHGADMRVTLDVPDKLLELRDIESRVKLRMNACRHVVNQRYARR